VHDKRNAKSTEKAFILFNVFHLFLSIAMQMSYIIVDEMHSEHPELIKDQYWDDLQFELPYTAASQPYKVAEQHVGSAANIMYT